MFSLGKKSGLFFIAAVIIVGSIFFINGEQKAKAALSTLFDFDLLVGLSTNFNNDGAGGFTNTITGGLSGSGSLVVPSLFVDDLYISKDSYSVATSGDIYTASMYFNPSHTGGNTGIGFSVDATASKGIYSTPNKGVGVIFNASGGAFVHAGSQLQSLVWASALIDGGWYKIDFELENKGSNLFDLKVDIYTSTNTGVIGSLVSSHSYVGLSSSDIGTATQLYSFISAKDAYVGVIDNFSVELDGPTFISAGFPVVITAETTGVTSVSAISGGNVSDIGLAAVTDRGVCYSLTVGPTLADTCVSVGLGLGVYVANLTGLTSNQQYYLRSYATNSVGTTYGGEKTFTTLDLTLEAPSITSISDDTGTSSADFITNDSSFEIYGTATTSATAVDVLVDGVSTGTTTIDVSGNWSISLSLTDGSYGLVGKTLSGLLSSASSTLKTVVVDTVNPTAPTTIASSTVSETEIGLNWSGASDERSGIDGYFVYRDGSLLATTSATTYFDTGLADNTEYSYIVSVVDIAGNVSASSTPLVVTTLDAVVEAPIITSITDDTGASSTDFITSDPSLLFSGIATTTLDYVALFVGGVEQATTSVGVGADWSMTVTLPEGTNSIDVVGIDAALSSASTSKTVVVDFTAPTLITGLATSSVATSSIGILWNSANDLLSGLLHYEIFRDSVSIATTTADSFLDSGLDHNTEYSYTVIGIDVAGNATVGTAPLVGQTLSLDIPTPSITSITDDTGASSTDFITNDPTITIAGTAATTTQFIDLYIDGSSAATSTIDGSGNWSLVIGLVDDSYQIETKAFIETSASASSTAKTLVIDTLTPSITSLATTTVDYNEISLSWASSTDVGSGVDFYSLYRDGGLLATTTDTSYSDTTVSATSSYTYVIKTADRAGNETASSSSIIINTPDTPINLVEIEFLYATTSATENISDRHVLAINGELASIGTVSIVDLGTGSASATDDYSASSTYSLSIPAGVYSNTTILPSQFVIRNNDTEVEGTETIEFGLSGASANVSIDDANNDGKINATSTWSIIDTDSLLVSFDDSGVSFFENSTSSPTVSLSVTGALLGATSTIDLVAVGGTATDVSDYGGLPLTLSVAPGDYSASVLGIAAPITIVDDSDIENDETITLGLSNSSGLLTISSASSTLTYTITDDDRDADSDGVDNSIEDAGFNSGDGNGDGISDSNQSNVASAPNGETGSYATLATSGDCSRITTSKMISESDLAAADPAMEYPYGLIDFTLSCNNPGDSGSVTMYFTEMYDTSNWVFRKFNRNTNTYIDASDEATYGTASVGTSTVTTISFTVTDGVVGSDEDETVNGTIIDPAGPAVAIVTTSSSGGGGGGSRSPRVCRDPEASNYNRIGRSDPTKCIYENEAAEEDLESTTATDSVVAANEPSSPVDNNNFSVGDVLVTDSICEPHLKENISIRRDNNPVEVNKLIRFLNENEGEKLVEDGIYNQDDMRTVMRFQEKYRDAVLDIWGLDEPTGYVFITTRNKINSFFCSQDITCPYFSEYNGLRNSTKTNWVKQSNEILRTKILLTELGFYDGVLNENWEKTIQSAMAQFHVTFSAAMLKPWNITTSEGLKYKTTNRFLNKLVGCNLPPEILDNGTVIDY